MYNQIENQKLSDYKVSSLENLPYYRHLMEVFNLKPNFSQLAKELGKDRRTVKKYYLGFEKATKRNKPSKIDPFYSDIEKLLSDECVQTFHYIRHLWRYMGDEHGLDVTESAFKHYINKHSKFKQYFEKKPAIISPVDLRFEVAPGEQMQIDWKEDFKYLTRDGEVIYLNVFVALLSYSRYSVYHVTLNRKQNTLLFVLNDTFDALGGVPESLLNDNMKTIMDESRTHYQPGMVNQKFDQFSKDYGFKVQPCIAYRPSTKGKVETQMKLLDEIDAYQGKFTFDELVAHIQKMNRRKNLEVHPSTGVAPIILFEYEKDFLSPLPRREIRSQYYYQRAVKVNSSAMISYKTNQYSVPPEYIGQRLGLEVEDNQLYLYDNTKLVANHPLSNRKLNYDPEHYKQAVALTMPYKSQEDIERFSKMNLERMSQIYDYQG